MVVAMDRTQQIFDASTFVEEAKKRWPVSRVFVNDQDWYNYDVGVDVDPVDSSPFSIDHYPDNRAVGSNADPYVAAEIAVWVRDLHPDPDLALWLVDDMFNGHVVLHPEITTEEVHAGWVDHREHDPYEEYPQYFPME